VLLSTKHKPTVPEERTRIEGAGGKRTCLFFSLTRANSFVTGCCVGSSFGVASYDLGPPLCFAHLPLLRVRLGNVVFGRLFGDLGVSRAFGDKDYKTPAAAADYMSVEPHYRSMTLRPGDDEFFVLACDGLWDKMT
jgi:hypothetical protein